jgi:hypothetical protein
VTVLGSCGYTVVEQFLDRRFARFRGTAPPPIGFAPEVAAHHHLYDGRTAAFPPAPLDGGPQ